jgi:mannose-6-phosphate isomerase-like protein (cupin superfamily)
MHARISTIAAVALVAITALPAAAQNATKLHWGPAPAVFPKGAKMAVVSGDPTKAGPFTIQLNMPNGYRIMPHFHPTDEHVAVKSGHFHYGMGDRFDPKAFKSMKPGESGDIPANMHHYAHAQGRTVIEVSSTGPFVLTYVNAKDDPSKMQH